jgi:hypothetical protein
MGITAMELARVAQFPWRQAGPRLERGCSHRGWTPEQDWPVSLEDVLRLRNSRTGSYAVVKPVQPGLLRMCAHVPETAGVTALRVLLVADLVARVAELGHLQALTVLVTADESAERMSELESAADALGIHPPAGRARSGNAPALLGGPADVHVVSSGNDKVDDQGGVVTRVGDARLRRTGARSPGTADPLLDREHDPLTVRFAMLSFPVHQAAELTDDALADASETVRDWRRWVARWSESPSRPVPPHLSEAVRSAFRDLDTPSAIALLHGLVHDDSVPSGAKFETFVYTDRILGLELPRDIGKPV